MNVFRALSCPSCVLPPIFRVILLFLCARAFVHRIRCLLDVGLTAPARESGKEDSAAEANNKPTSERMTGQLQAVHLVRSLGTRATWAFQRSGL